MSIEEQVQLQTGILERSLKAKCSFLIQKERLPGCMHTCNHFPHGSISPEVGGYKVISFAVILGTSLISACLPVTSGNVPKENLLF